jgi:hypothetical protein
VQSEEPEESNSSDSRSARPVHCVSGDRHVAGHDEIIGFATVFGLCLGLYQFYVGKIKKGLLYTITFGGLLIGCTIDLFRLAFTKTFKDANGFPLIY